MFDILNNWEKLDWYKETFANFNYDKFWNHETNKFEYVISLTTDDEDEIFKFTVCFEFNKNLEKGTCYVYIDIFDARNYDELMTGNDFLKEIENKCQQFEDWLILNEYGRNFPGRCYLKKTNQN